MGWKCCLAPQRMVELKSKFLARKKIHGFPHSSQTPLSQCNRCRLHIGQPLTSTRDAEAGDAATICGGGEPAERYPEI